MSGHTPMPLGTPIPKNAPDRDRCPCTPNHRNGPMKPEKPKR